MRTQPAAHAFALRVLFDIPGSDDTLRTEATLPVMLLLLRRISLRTCFLYCFILDGIEQLRPI